MATTKHHMHRTASFIILQDQPLIELNYTIKIKSLITVPSSYSDILISLSYHRIEVYLLSLPLFLFSYLYYSVCPFFTLLFIYCVYFYPSLT
ncbi:hypothetical protein RIF29_17756 [Crotalaria pallida]|uniref:Uncharacterized protein n=1 Tax=Crotalaria pallida TaxID=3830 RepID=A0AAN9FPL8_CROPI